MFTSAQRPNPTGYPFTQRVHLLQMTILISHDQLPSCSSVGRATVIYFEDRGFESRRDQRFFLFLRVVPFPF